MAETDTKPRKSVAFSDSPADSPQLAPTADPAVDDVTNMFAGLTKKKKPSSKKSAAAALLSEEAAEDSPAQGSDAGDIDLSLMKKKKKKPKAADAGTADDFEAKLAKAGVTEDGSGAGATEGKDMLDEKQALADLKEGKGIWSHNCKTPIPYNLLLARFFEELHNKNPDIGLGGSRSYKIPPPQCLREGNKKTIFANIPDICKKMNRSEDHVTSFLFAELGTSGSVDGSRRLVIKGRFQQKQIENVIRRYIIEYVTCKTCKSPDTELNKGENRLYFITCRTCGSRRSVTAVKTGYKAQIGKRKKMQA